MGAIFGIILGVVLCLLQQEFGLIKLSGNADAVIVSSYPVKVIWTDIIIVFALDIIIGLLTSLVTASLMRSRLKR